jgi:hypothetical protein
LAFLRYERRPNSGSGSSETVKLASALVEFVSTVFGLASLGSKALIFWQGCLGAPQAVLCSEPSNATGLWPPGEQFQTS